MTTVAFWRSYSDLDPRWAGMTPLYALSLVAHARHRGFTVNPIYCKTADEMVKTKADIYCISSVTPTWAESLDLVKRLDGRKIIIGGPHITALSNLTPPGTIGVVGEGEKAFAAILNDQISFPHDPDVTTTGEYPRLDLSRCDHLPVVVHTSNNNLMAVTSRGCPFRCWFCCAWKCWSENNKPVVTRFTAKHVADEIGDFYKTHKPGAVSFHDLNFATSAEWLEELADRLETQGLGERFVIGACSFSAAFARPEILAPLKRMGVKSLGIGMETAGQALHKRLKPHMKFEWNLKLIELAKQFDLIVGASFIVGAPGETESDLAETEAFILKHKGPNFRQTGLFMFAPLPGSDAWNELLKAGKVSEKMDWSQFAIGLGSDVKHAWFNDNMSYKAGLAWRNRISVASRMK